jgi:phosphohistidine phosphatase
MILYIIRHAWAAERGDPQWPDDDLRPLTEEGGKRFDTMVRTLLSRGFHPELIATSPLVRCRQTADVLAKAVSGKPVIVERSELVPGSDLEGIVRWTNRQSGRHDEIAWVGHAPDVSHLAGALIGDRRNSLRFAKGGIAAIQFDGPVEADQGELCWLVTAKILGC